MIMIRFSSNFSISRWYPNILYCNILLTVPPLSHIGYFMDWLLKRTAGNIRLDRKSFFKFISWFFFSRIFRFSRSNKQQQCNCVDTIL